MKLSNLEKFQMWSERALEQDIKQLINRNGDKLVRKDLCQEIGIGLTSFKAGSEANTKNIQALEAFEEELRKQGVLKDLKPKSEAETSNTASAYKLEISDGNNSEIQRILNEKKAVENALQKMTKQYLEEKAKNRKLEELAAIVAELGLLSHEN
ncbi:hypothetical protein AB4205_04290 [Vibrio sp. 10N.286.49.F3]|uniref:hypothetical protein n=1 Tax=Vibrio sp. 10N.286.49.F3 TaxID=3229704 RepID=UPI0035505655